MSAPQELLNHQLSQLRKLSNAHSCCNEQAAIASNEYKKTIEDAERERKNSLEELSREENSFLRKYKELKNRYDRAEKSGIRLLDEIGSVKLYEQVKPTLDNSSAIEDYISEAERSVGVLDNAIKETIKVRELRKKILKGVFACIFLISCFLIFSSDFVFELIDGSQFDDYNSRAEAFGLKKGVYSVGKSVVIDGDYELKITNLGYEGGSILTFYIDITNISSSRLLWMSDVDSNEYIYLLSENNKFIAVGMDGVFLKDYRFPKGKTELGTLDFKIPDSNEFEFHYYSHDPITIDLDELQFITPSPTPSEDLAKINNLCVTFHTVKRNDSISEIALEYLDDALLYDVIVKTTNKANKEDSSFAKITDPTRIEIGDKLCIPDMESASITKSSGDVLSLAVESTPTPTSRPTKTSTPNISPTSTLVHCSRQVRGEFSNLWNKYKSQLGCPHQERPLDGAFAEQPFENGHMFYADVGAKFFMITLGFEEGRWYFFSDDQVSWQEGMAPESCTVQPPPPGLQQPYKGFGWIWCNGLRESIGWARDQERGFDFDLVQGFDKGIIFRDSDGKTNRKAYIFFHDGDLNDNNYNSDYYIRERY